MANSNTFRRLAIKNVSPGTIAISRNPKRAPFALAINKENIAMSKFPMPYINSIPSGPDKSIVEIVPLDDMDIGARKSGLPSKSDVKRDSMTVEHVGGSAGKGG